LVAEHGYVDEPASPIRLSEPEPHEPRYRIAKVRIADVDEVGGLSVLGHPSPLDDERELSRIRHIGRHMDIPFAGCKCPCHHAIANA
jgi:hypothetical protein